MWATNSKKIIFLLLLLEFENCCFPQNVFCFVVLLWSFRNLIYFDSPQSSRALQLVSQIHDDTDYRKLHCICTKTVISYYIYVLIYSKKRESQAYMKTKSTFYICFSLMICFSKKHQIKGHTYRLKFVNQKTNELEIFISIQISDVAQIFSEFYL